MLNYEHIKSYDLSSLKFCLSGGAPLPLETKLKFEALAGATKVVEGYGLSVVERVPIEIKPSPKNISYLKTKMKKMGHLLTIE